MSENDAAVLILASKKAKAEKEKQAAERAEAKANKKSENVDPTHKQRLCDVFTPSCIRTSSVGNFIIWRHFLDVDNLVLHKTDWI